MLNIDSKKYNNKVKVNKKLVSLKLCVRDVEIDMCLLHVTVPRQAGFCQLCPFTSPTLPT